MNDQSIDKKHSEEDYNDCVKTRLQHHINTSKRNRVKYLRKSGKSLWLKYKQNKCLPRSNSEKHKANSISSDSCSPSRIVELKAPPIPDPKVSFTIY